MLIPLGHAEVLLEPGHYPLVRVQGRPLPATSRLKALLDRLDALQDHPDSSCFQRLLHPIHHEIQRASVYQVSKHKGRRVWQEDRVAEKPPEFGRQRYLDDQVTHVDLHPDPEEPLEGTLMRVCRAMAPRPLLGVKPRAQGLSAVFLPTSSFETSLRATFGDPITDAVLQEDRLDRLQFLCLLAHREGQRTRTGKTLNFANLANLANPDEAYDGLIADLDPATWSTLLAAFQLPPETTWVQATVFDRDQGLATKGALRKSTSPATYLASWKIGHPRAPVPLDAILVHETDATYRPEASLNLQQLAYNFTPEEQQTLLRQVFIPGVERLLDYQWTARLRGIDRLLAAGADLRLEPVCRRINLLRRKLALEAIHRVEVPGFRAKVAPDPSLAPFTCRVPANTFPLDTLVDVTRDPSLPVGTSTQRFRVVGHTPGFVVEVGPDPWMTVMGGDFDGDDGCVQTTTVELFPDKTYSRLPVKAFRQAKTRRRLGIQDEKARFEQALRVMERPIGPHDLTARRLLERGLLDSKARFRLTEAIQAAIDSAKHAAPVIDPGYRHDGHDHAIDAIRRGDLQAAAIQGTLYEPLVKAAHRVANDDLQPVTFDPMPIRLAYAALAARFSKADMGRLNCLAGVFQTRFAGLCKSNASERQFARLVDECCVALETTAAELHPLDTHHTRLPLPELCLVAGEITLLRRASLHFAARVVRLRTLRLVFDRDAHFVRQAFQAKATLPQGGA